MWDFKRCKMNIEEFKKLYTSDLATFSVTTLDHYIIEGNKLIANMKVVDPIVLEIVAKLEEYKSHCKG